MIKAKKGDILVVTISKITPYNAECKILEYPDYTGFLHISEVSSAWTKNIHHHIKVGQMRAAKVLNVDEKSKVIEISLRRVSKSEEQEAIEAYKNEKSAQKIIQAALQKAKSRKKLGPIERKLKKKYGGIFNYLEEVSQNPDLIKELPEEIQEIVLEEVQRRFAPKDVTIRAQFKIETYEPDGILRIKELFNGLDVFYLGGGQYYMDYVAPDYKQGHKELKPLLSQLEKKAKELNLNFSYEVLN